MPPEGSFWAHFGTGHFVPPSIRWGYAPSQRVPTGRAVKPICNRGDKMPRPKMSHPCRERSRMTGYSSISSSTGQWSEPKMSLRMRASRMFGAIASLTRK